jgi:hypothetical protein
MWPGRSTPSRPGFGRQQAAVDVYAAQQHIAASGKRPRPIEGVRPMT